ncbi:MAG: polysaccharide lyase 8 family protein [Planctomycetota bacterium]
MIRYMLLLCFIGGACSHIADANDTPCAEDLQTIKKRLRVRQLQGVDQGLRRQANRYARDLAEDGSWAGVDYADKSRARWKPSEHLNRLVALARAQQSWDGSSGGNGKLKQAVLAAFRHWIEKDYQSDNWWWNIIYTPRQLVDVMVLMENALPAEDLRKGLAITRRAWPKSDRQYMTGANLVWRAKTAIKQACLEGNCQLLHTAASAVDDTAKIKSGEGIQADYSFHQHGPQLYSGSYGMAFTGDWAEMASLLRNTQFAFDTKHVRNFRGYLLDGQQWMVRDGLFDYSPCGRAVTRKGGTRPDTLREAALHLAKLDTPRHEELVALARKLEDGSFDPGEGPRGNRNFWRSDFMVHRRKAFYASVNVTSTRTRGAEVVNQEGIKSYHLAHGCNYLLLQADEYKSIFPVWDWQRVPGVTCEQIDGSLPRPGGLGSTDFAGGVSDGEYGAAAFIYHDRKNPGHAKAKKAWFFFDSEYVCLGAGIQCESDNPVYTSVNQCLLDGEVQVANDNGIVNVEQGQTESGNFRKVKHDGVTYVFPRSQKAFLSTQTQSGSWWEINHPSPKEPVTLPVFSLWIDHGEKPEAASYCYLVMIGAKWKESSTSAKDLPVQIIDNDPSLQAVYHRDLNTAQIVFYEPGRVQLPDGVEWTLNQPGMLMLRDVPGGVQLCVSSPEHRSGTVKITCNRELSGSNCAWNASEGVTEVIIDLPDGLHAGESVVKVLEEAD